MEKRDELNESISHYELAMSAYRRNWGIFFLIAILFPIIGLFVFRSQVKRRKYLLMLRPQLLKDIDQYTGAPMEIVEMKYRVCMAGRAVPSFADDLVN
jgi:hypothetical protein